MLAARPLGTYKGKRVHRFPVQVRCNSSHLLATVATLTYLVHSTSAAKAADCIYQLFATRAETEITVFGPRGGKAAYRFIGWQSAVSNAMIAQYGRPEQQRLTFD